MLEKIFEGARQLGIETCLEFSPKLLVPEQRIREFCLENKCGNYGNNHMCPPRIGSLAEATRRLKRFSRGIMLRYSKILDVKNDRRGATQAKLDLHNKILRLEELLKNEGAGEVWGMSGGSCSLCEVCGAEIGEPCSHPDKARTSPEAIGIDVLSLLARLGQDNRFYPDRITWTGCILFNLKQPGSKAASEKVTKGEHDRI